MNDPLRRKMFRQVGMSKQPMGILASSPELMNTVKGYNVGGINLLNQDPPPPMVRDIKTASLQIPFYGANRYSLTGDIKPITRPGSSVIEDPNLTGETPLALLKKQAEEAKKKKAEENKIIDTSLETKPNIINATNKKIIDEEKKVTDNPFTNKTFTDDSTTTDDNQTPEGSLTNQFRNQLNKVTDIQKKAVADLNSANVTADQYKLGGKTVAERIEGFTSLINKKGQEPTLADVKDDAIKLLGFDPDKLDERFDEDKQASVWLNMMKAGLAVAAGESSNALTNIAKGFSFGLDQYGKDIGKLKTELREDKKDAANTMYKLLKDKKSEDLAKKTLEIQQQQGLLNIQMKYIGEQRKQAMDAYNMQMDGAKWNVSLIGTLAKLEQDELKMAFDKENLEKTFRLGLAKATPKEIVFLRQSGDIKLKPGITEEIPFGDPKYFDQFDVTATGKQKLLEMASNIDKPRQLTDFKYEGRSYGETGRVGPVYLPNIEGASTERKKQFGINAARHMELLEKRTNSYDKLMEILAFARQEGAKIRMDNLPPDMQEHLKQTSGGKNAKSLLDLYSDILVR
tara:strand:- start:1160 stop:2869 length:1710 start_codon:yes stop_codon:yes gene_type:complete